MRFGIRWPRPKLQSVLIDELYTAQRELIAWGNSKENADAMVQMLTVRVERLQQQLSEANGVGVTTSGAVLISQVHAGSGLSWPSIDG